MHDCRRVFVPWRSRLVVTYTWVYTCVYIHIDVHTHMDSMNNAELNGGLVFVREDKSEYTHTSLCSSSENSNLLRFRHHSVQKSTGFVPCPSQLSWHVYKWGVQHFRLETKQTTKQTLSLGSYQCVTELPGIPPGFPCQVPGDCYGMAMISRLIQNIGLFRRI